MKHMSDALIEVETIDRKQVDNLVKYGTLTAPEETAITAGEEDVQENVAPPAQTETSEKTEAVSPWGNPEYSDTKK